MGATTMLLSVQITRHCPTIYIYCTFILLSVKCMLDLFLLWNSLIQFSMHSRIVYIISYGINLFPTGAFHLNRFLINLISLSDYATCHSTSKDGPTVLIVIMWTATCCNIKQQHKNNKTKACTRAHVMYACMQVHTSTLPTLTYTEYFCRI